MTVPCAGDFHGLFPKWENVNAKRRNNNTWKMPVNVGFKYLIRVHFSELGLKIARNGDNKFKVLINEMIARTNIDVVKESDENKILWYRDYTVKMRGNKKEGKRDILISLQSYDELIDDQVLVSGFEIFKLSNSDNSLASPNPSPLARDSTSHTVTLFLFLYHRNAIADVAIAMMSLVCIIGYNLRKIWEANITDEENKTKPKPKPSPSPSPSARAERTCRRFSLDEIQLATKNFNDALLIGRGGFGEVYKGHIDNKQTTVAIERLKSSSKQGAQEFLAEIETLSELRHVNLVSLIGYCNEEGEMILVYEYMPRGTLANHIYKLAGENNACSSLTWKQCLDICIGAGRGLDYLHTGHGVIHRDIKASNILLDENFIAKVSDFGLAKLENKSKLKTHITTNVKGTFGYLDPNYFNTHKLTRKSDTYAFGVVLLEVLCGRPAVDLKVPEDKRVLSKWARDMINMGEADQIVSVSLREEISPNSLKTFVGIAQRCLSNELKNRPTMSQVVSQLEFAVEQQETKQLSEIAASFSNDIHCLHNHKDGPSVHTGQPTIFSTAVQNFTNDPIKQTNRNVIIAQLPQNENDGLLVQTGQPTIFSTAVQNFTPPPKEQTNSDVVIALPLKGNELPSISDLLRRFSFEEIKTATGNLDANSIINNGFSFNVHKGFIEDGATTVAIKRVNRWSICPPKFRDKIKMLQQIRHLNLVSLIGYCDEGIEKILVYEYMACGSLHDHLYNSEKNAALTWKRRLQICIGAAVGLHYIHIHKEYNQIMHRRVGCTNILLDEKWVAKVSLGPRYIGLLQFTTEQDVLYLGVVLFEVLFAKPREPIYLDKCIEFCKKKGTLKEKVQPLHGHGTELYIDYNLYDQIAPECLSKFVETAVSCINEVESERPTMSDVIRSLEFAMQLQEAAEH